MDWIWLDGLTGKQGKASINKLPGYKGRHKPIRKDATLGYPFAVESVCKRLEAFAQGFGYIRPHFCHEPGTSPLAKQRAVKSLVLREMLEYLHPRLRCGLRFRDLSEEFQPRVRRGL